MYPTYNMPPWMFPPSSGPPVNPVNQITDWINGLEALKKHFKEEKKEEKKKERPEISTIGVMLFMLLIAPITGPTMFKFFQLSLNLMPATVAR